MQLRAPGCSRPLCLIYTNSLLCALHAEKHKCMLVCLHNNKIDLSESANSRLTSVFLQWCPSSLPLICSFFCFLLIIFPFTSLFSSFWTLLHSSLLHLHPCFPHLPVSVHFYSFLFILSISILSSFPSLLPLFRLCKVQLGFGAFGLQAWWQEDALSEYALLGSLCVTLYFFALLFYSYLPLVPYCFFFLFLFLVLRIFSSRDHPVFLWVFSLVEFFSFEGRSTSVANIRSVLQRSCQTFRHQWKTNISQEQIGDGVRLVLHILMLQSVVTVVLWIIFKMRSQTTFLCASN